MMKKLTALCGALVLALSLSACGGTAAQLPALVLEDPAASNAASQVSGAESGTQEEPPWKRCPTPSLTTAWTACATSHRQQGRGRGAHRNGL